MGVDKMLVFSLLTVNQNKLNNIVDKIKGLGKKYVNKVHLVYGEYDVIAELKVSDPDMSAEMLRTLKETEGVKDLKTYVVSDQLKEGKPIELLSF